MQTLSRVSLSEKETTGWCGLGNVGRQVCHSPGSYHFVGPPYDQTDPGTAGLKISPSHRPHQQPPGDSSTGGSSHLALPGLLHVSTGQRDPPSGQPFL